MKSMDIPLVLAG